MRQLFHLSFRQTQGFVKDLFEWLDLPLTVTSYSQLQRRSGKLQVDLMPTGVQESTPVAIVIDSTDLKVKAEGDGVARAVEGAPARQRGTWQWLKLSLVSEPQSLQILAYNLTDNAVDDAQSGLELLGQLPLGVASCATDGAYDKKKFRSPLPAS
ncbi:transposase [Spirosoma sp. HMF3257]|uniref:Transposase DDE domain-containing protein n=1 Tax=Spirosoma telluris TaxID=2183553 RepID=A0A327NUL8_9BACT|nr:transposase [Spirosoma telluris]RAI78129.1 hypothetical protein HMF3257_35840 [Spirosoma telluris]